MIDLSSINPTTALLAGGGIAAITAGWQHVKEFFRVISSILVIRAEFRDVVASDVVYLLKSEFKQYSVGYGVFVRKKHVANGRFFNIPYQVIPKVTVFRRGRTFLLVTQWWDDAMDVSSIRGFFKPIALVQEAMEKRNVQRESESQNRYYITMITGAEKLPGGSGFGGHQQHGKSAVNSTPAGEDYGGLSHDSISRLLQPIIEIDEPLLYSRDELLEANSHGFDGLVYDPEVMDEVEEAANWLKSSEWYTSRFIPWSLGWLLYGRPGSGKTSLALATARKLGLPVYNFVLSTLSNQEFMDRWETMSTPCMVLFEDFDAAFDGREPLSSHKTLTFDCLINQISGTGQQNGVMLVITTNDVSKLDAAIGCPGEAKSGITSRPGRIDRYIELNACSPTAKKFIIDKILVDYSEDERLDIVAECDEDWTVVQVQAHCIAHVQNDLRTKRKSLPQ